MAADVDSSRPHGGVIAGSARASGRATVSEVWAEDDVIGAGGDEVSYHVPVLAEEVAHWLGCRPSSCCSDAQP